MSQNRQKNSIHESQEVPKPKKEKGTKKYWIFLEEGRNGRGKDKTIIMHGTKNFKLWAKDKRRAGEKRQIGGR